jgi:beta-barrel assembly-enhancing protease
MARRSFDLLKRHKLVFVAVLTASAAFAQLKTPKPGFNLFSREQDVQLGREAAAQIERQVQVVRDSELQEYVNRIGRRLASTQEAGQYPYTFKVVNDPSINAFALPGGPTYIHSGLIRAADNEAQVAGVMAHEIAHVALRHGTNQASKANLIQLPAMLAGAIAGNGSILGQLAQLGVGLGANSVLLKFSRDAERDADLLGANMMARAGYNPIEMARFFEKLEAQGGSRGPQFLSDHPNPGNRVKYVSDQVRYLPQSNYSTGDPNAFRRAQNLVSGLPNPGRGGFRQSQVQGNGDPRPSGRMTEFRSQTFSIAHPDNWEAFGDREGAVVTIAPRSGLAQDGNGSVQIIYGVMAGYEIGDGRREDLRHDTDELISQLVRSNPGMQAGQQKRGRVAGQEAIITTLIGTSPYRGERENNTVITVQRPQGLFYMVYVTPESGLSQLNPTFDQMLRSVRFSQ